MKALLKRFMGLFRKKETGPDGSLPFKDIFSRFRQVLNSNDRALEIMADMGDKLSGGYILDTKYIKRVYSEFADTVFKSIYNLNALSQNKYPQLHNTFERINDQVKRILKGKPPSGPADPVLFYSEVSWEISDEVGEKNARLAELKNFLKLNVPDGFAITAGAFRRFVEHNRIDGKITDLKRKYRKAAKRSVQDDVMAAIAFAEAGEHETAKEILHEEDYLKEPFYLDVQKLFSKGSLPADVAEKIESAVNKLSAEHGEDFYLAVRSSAEEEDGDHSFAGQFETELNVPADKKAMETAYKNILSSLFSPKAMAYKEQIMSGNKIMPMSVGCIKMVDAWAGGVMYSSDPGNLNSNAVMISAAWGLGKTVAEGEVDADQYQVEKTEPYRVREKKAGTKKIAAMAKKGGGIYEARVPEDKQSEYCLTEEQLKELTRQAVVIENYFKKPQDIEWAVDAEGTIFILQSRDLKVLTSAPERLSDISTMLGKHPVLMDKKGMIAQRGIGSGRVFVLENMDELNSFEPGSVLVAKHDSSQFIRIMPRAAAIITTTGTPTSHMSNIAREFQVPTIVNAGAGTEALKNGDEITVDADENRIYAGIVQELLRFKVPDDSGDIKGTKEFRLLKRVLRYVTPLNLIDPLTDDFTPEACRSFHDIIRLIHEKAVTELVNVDQGDLIKNNTASKLFLAVPADIYVIDIGGGMSSNGTGNAVTPNEISSIPFRAVIEGMAYPDVWHSEAVSARINDLMSGEKPDPEGMRYPGDHVAVVSREYINLSLRFGSHFNMLDCYCSENIRDNHIYFRFIGGGPDITKRSRRVELLSLILKELNLRVHSRSDLVIGRIGNISRVEIEGILNRLGRLIAYTRQLDVLLENDSDVNKYAGQFIDGNYELN